MKKTMSILLAFILSVLSVCACADTMAVQPGALTDTSMILFKAYFTNISDKTGYPFTWETEPVFEDGYEVYTVRSDGPGLSLKVYSSGGRVSHVLGSLDGYNVNNTVEVGTMGLWFGGALYSVIAAFYFTEGNSSTTEAAAALSDGVSRIMESLADCTSSEAVLNGAVSTTAVLDYPVGFEVSATSMSIPVTLSLKFAVTNKNGTVQNSAAQASGGWRQAGGVWQWIAADGSMATGWKEIDSNWYWFAEDGSMATGWKEIDGSWYYLDNDGHMVTGWKEIDSTWYYFDDDGHMVTGWKEIDGTWYWFADSGAMATGTCTIDGTEYTFDSNGAWQDSSAPAADTGAGDGWVEVDGDLYYIENGAPITGWQLIGDEWYYFHGNGAENSVIRPLVSETGEDPDLYYIFSCPICKSMEFEPEDLYDKVGAAWFSDILLVDYAIANDEEPDPGMLFDPSLLSDISYVGLDGSCLNLMLYSESKKAAFFAFYGTKTNTAFSFYVAGVSLADAEYFFNGLCADGNIQNSQEAIQAVYDYILNNTGNE